MQSINKITMYISEINKKAWGEEKGRRRENIKHNYYKFVIVTIYTNQ